MKSLLKKLSQDRWAILIILVTLAVSYGQLLGMNFWQDDNAVVFKFTHLNEDAGYLGKGIWGEGAYRYTVASYFPIFYFFGYNPLPYFIWAFIFLIANVLAVYFFFNVLLENRLKATMAGFIYAAGYIASDGFIRMFNSVLTSLSVIFVCGAVGFYYKFSQTNRVVWYLLSLLTYFLAIEVGYIRTHFLILVIVAAELIFLLSKEFSSVRRAIVNVMLSLLRLTPFVWLFYKWYLISADNRSGQVLVLFNSFLKGEFYNSYSFFGSLGNMLLPNEVLPLFLEVINKIIPIPLTESRVVFGFIIILITIYVLLIRSKIVSKRVGFLFVLFSIVILTWSRQAFSFPGLVGGLNEKISLYAGISFLILCLSLLWALPYKKLSFLFVFWMVFNLGAYGAYIPIYAYPSDNRYLLQSFIPLIGLLSLWSYALWEKMKLSRFSFIPILVVISYGMINLYSSFSWQQKILDHRSLPSKRFFFELQQYVSSFKKDSIFYFYIPDKPFAKTHYDNGFSVAQMPEETAIAWRYGVDRYDLSVVNSFDNLKAKMEEKKVPIESVYAFIADPDRLIDVTMQTRRLLKTGASQEEERSSKAIVNLDSEKRQLSIKPILIHPQNVSSLTALKVTFNLIGDVYKPENKLFPINFGDDQSVVLNSQDRELYLSFRKWQERFYQSAKIVAQTSWRIYTVDKMLDKDPETYWEADRVAWDDHNQGFTIDLGEVLPVGGIIYRNGPPSLTPTEFEILTSPDGFRFTNIKTVRPKISERDQIQKVTFAKIDTRFIKVLFHQTQYDDAPGVSEVEVLPDEFRGINPVTAEKFFQNPFARVDTIQQWQEVYNNFWDRGLIKIVWKTDASDREVTSVSSTIPVVYDGKKQEVSIEIPGGGEKLEYIKIIPLTIPGDLTLSKIIYQNIPFYKN